MMQLCLTMIVIIATVYDIIVCILHLFIIQIINVSFNDNVSSGGSRILEGGAHFFEMSLTVRRAPPVAQVRRAAHAARSMTFSRKWAPPSKILDPPLPTNPILNVQLPKVH